jgi:hypothetical protein
MKAGDAPELGREHRQLTAQNLQSKWYRCWNPSTTGNWVAAQQAVEQGDVVKSIALGALAETVTMTLVVVLVELVQRRDFLVVVFPAPDGEHYIIARHPLSSAWHIDCLDGVVMEFRWTDAKSLASRAQQQDDYLTLEGLDSDAEHAADSFWPTMELPKDVPLAVGFQYDSGRYTNFVPVEVFSMEDSTSVPRARGESPVPDRE